MTKRAETKYREAPEQIATIPRGIPFIIGNEAAERFSFYGMRAILVLFMTQFMLNQAGTPDHFSEPKARAWYHTFVSAVYLTPLLGALLSDIWLGKYKTIISLSLVYCMGHAALAISDTRAGLLLGLGLIALGAGGIKPCVSAHVGDQFARSNEHLMPAVYGWFYISINLGATISMLLAEPLLRRYGPNLAFGVPGLLMALATFVFWAGRYRYAHIPPAGKRFGREALGPMGINILFKLLPIYATLVVFWSLFDQTGSSWVQQAGRMNRNFIVQWGATQTQWLNPVFVLILVPLFSRVVYPAVNRIWHLTALRKIGAGMFVATAAFLASAWIQSRIDRGESVLIVWQVLPYLLLTTAEVMISVTGLEFSYTQAPPSVKSLIMAAYLATTGLGNLFTGAVNFWIESGGHAELLTGASYYLFFAALMFVTGLIFIPIARHYREHRFLQDAQVDR